MSEITDAERIKAAQNLLDAAHQYWRIERDRSKSPSAAVRWLSDATGAVLIFTRGEYRETLMRNIDALTKDELIERFPEHIPEPR